MEALSLCNSPQGYHNEVVIAGSDAVVGHNPGINESEQISGTGDKSFEGKITAPAGTDHRGPLSGRPAGPASVAPQQDWKSAHEEEKMALIVAGVGVGLMALWLGSR